MSYARLPAFFNHMMMAMGRTLFGVIALMNAALPFLPKVPSFASSGVGVVLTVVGGSWLAPVGLAGLYMDGRGRTLEHRQ